MPMRSPIIIITLVLAAILAVVGGFVIFDEQMNTQIATLRNDLAQLETRTATLEDDLATLLAANDLLSSELIKEQGEREALQVLQQEQEAKLADVSTQFSTLASEEATAIVARWEPFVYKLTCTFDIASEDNTNSGSAIVEKYGNTIRFLTNEHVLEESGQNPTECTISKPDSKTEVVVPGSAITVENDVDLGYGVVGETIPAFDTGRRCTQKPAIGDRVIILGYPGIGAKDSVTATEGIISGFENDFYVTSAKIESGNSGGAAIDVQNDCLLGLPTLVHAGRIESLARILPL